MRKTLTFAATAVLVAQLTFTASEGAQTAGDQQTLDTTAASHIIDEANARIADIKAILRLTADQEKNWSGFESSLRDLAKKRADRLVAYRAERQKTKEPTGLLDHWRRRASAFSRHSATLTSLADAAQSLYATLDERQRTVSVTCWSPSRRLVVDLDSLPGRWSNSLIVPATMPQRE